MFFFDPMYFVFSLPAILLVLFAQWKVQSAYNKYTRIPNERGMTGIQTAQRLLQANGLSGVNVEGAPGELTDHYDPSSKTLHLSRGVANVPSVASIAIVAHEIGHAMQDATGYLPLRARVAIVPAVNIGSMLGPILVILGIVLRFTGLAWFGLGIFSLALVFAVVTLPVEIDASRRALAMLSTNGLVSRFESDGVKAVLTAAALTYVAAVAQALSQILYYAFILLGVGGRRDSR
ncbi:MAG: zinc metallopeptidase [Chloroflexi bacterium]|nr:zinc metallopeptidase [Chloroflexota bacterium]